MGSCGFKAFRGGLKVLGCSPKQKAEKIWGMVLQKVLCLASCGSKTLCDHRLTEILL